MRIFYFQHNVWVGLRPARLPLRLSSEIKQIKIVNSSCGNDSSSSDVKKDSHINCNDGSSDSKNDSNNSHSNYDSSINTEKPILIAHCYGHGGSGVTLSWGCAEDIVNNHILPFLLKLN